MFHYDEKKHEITIESVKTSRRHVAPSKELLAVSPIILTSLQYRPHHDAAENRPMLCGISEAAEDAIIDHSHGIEAPSAKELINCAMMQVYFHDSAPADPVVDGSRTSQASRANFVWKVYKIRCQENLLTLYFANSIQLACERRFFAELKLRSQAVSFRCYLDCARKKDHPYGYEHYLCSMNPNVQRDLNNPNVQIQQHICGEPTPSHIALTPHISNTTQHFFD